MILQCQSCSKVKKFGEWIEVLEGLRELMKDLKIIHTLCPRCEGLTVSSLPKGSAVYATAQEMAEAQVVCAEAPAQGGPSA